MKRTKGILCGLILLTATWVNAQSPHGQGLTIRCDACHTVNSWLVNRDSISFSHDSTLFPLSGQHVDQDCRQCHASLVFEKASADCISCHQDPHQQSVGPDCARCHTTQSWIVQTIAELHRQISFPLLGAHAAAECSSCHRSETALRFEPMATDCYSCHEETYAATLNPDHTKAGYSTNCVECHQYDAYEWTATGFNHDFFPLTKGHDIQECAQCHKDPDYSKTSPECITCHEADYKGTLDPNHQTASLSSSCAECHTTDPGWSPADYRLHDMQYFPIYSGSHEGEWQKCSDCHDNPDNYSSFTCITCHQENPTGEEHSQVFGYSYTSSACLACHPNGDAEDNFHHEETNFPLTGAHTSTECLQCHTTGFGGTPTSCFACHEADFNQSENPNHVALGLSTDCATCHTTDPDWNPAKFDEHNTYYVLQGAHAVIADQCVRCHNGDYNNTPNTCVGCHQADFDQTTSPSHTVLHFSTDCTTCHTEESWIPSTFDHDGQYFPIYSGKHEGEWDACKDCHIEENNYSVYTCITCHANPETDDHHAGVSGYAYSSPACLGCHPGGDEGFDHNGTAFPLTGAHTTTACVSCHSGGYAGTATECRSCHMEAYNQSINPNHPALGFSMDCAACHTTEPGWSPARLDNHNDYWVLSGAHLDIASQCIKCHMGDYNNTPSTCAGCHQEDFNQTTDPPHVALQFTTECSLCHNVRSWSPTTFEHDEQYFPIFSGTHNGLWNQCSDCHTNPNNYGEYTCTTCHTNPETDDQHNGIAGYSYNSSSCLGCHPTGEGDGVFDHSTTDFPLTGAHTTLQCLSCHANGYQGTPTDCEACHMTDYNQSTNPNHITLALPTDCATCHTTDPDWDPASFAIHNQYYALNGAHALIADQCVTCHNGDYNNTPNTCVGCHQSDYDQTTNPSHTTLNFSTECSTCHTESSWSPADYSGHDQNFPIYSGAHNGVWDQCTDCHTNPSNYGIFTCVTCHVNPETNNQHAGVGGYIYESNACYACHPTGESQGAFNHNTSNFPLTGAHQMVDCIECHAGGYQGTPTDCEACHMTDYNQSTNPSHITLALPTDCAICHTTDPDWDPASFAIHNQYYALNGAHALIADQCVTCHNGDYNNTPNTCVGCHLDDYNQTDNPPHQALNFSTECATCHTESAWIPAEYTEHDNQYFPIYSGTHAGEWSQCSDCHTNASNYGIFTCVTCHVNPETNNQHAGVGGYIYESNACYACHPTGESQGAFNHNTSNFPLTGAHQMVDCIECHAGGYQGTPTDCEACHMTDYNQSTNPSHITLALPTDCATCHTTDPDWDPASFAIHNQYYALNGAHALIADQCVTCHNGDYNNTPNTCVGCHLDDYNQTDNPPHQALNFSTECATCHTETAWIPAEYTEHDNQYFPIYSGTHAGEWSQCSDCHTNASNYGIFTCVTCHTNPETNNQHAGVSGYIYESNACYACHPTGDSQGAFNHANSNFPLTGAHQGVDCIECHAGGYQGTPTDCEACHMTDYNQSTNPSHITLALSTDCATCHTTDPDWDPASFAIHNQYYALNGAHALIADQCVTCHNGDYNNTPNTCVGCHLDDYNQTDNPPHAALNFSTECTLCHQEDAWIPASFSDHDGQYFPIYSGTHAGEWSQCSDCHTNASNYGIFTCVTCHVNPETNNQHAGVGGYIYESNACYACHPTGESQGAFNHNTSNFPLTGAHQMVDCIECHAGGYQGTPTDCEACHMTDYNQSTNPSHITLALPTDCATCHTTDPDWDPASFAIHNQYYALNGAHALIADQCVTCHNGEYNNTPNTCVGCHQTDYNQTTNPSHIALNFSTNCELCHSEDAWVPASFSDHDSQYFPIYSGGHQGAWDQCSDCHTNPNNYDVYTCVTCHTNPETNQQHVGINGYVYENSACFACHPTGDAANAFDHDQSNFPLTGAHLNVSCIECHAGGYQGTPTACDACHLPDYNQSSNPSHTVLNLSTDCVTCHTTAPDWNPALFPNHNSYYPLLGAHASIANQCVLCHNGDYNNTPNTCAGCHITDYNQTNNPDHQAMGFPTTCETCHSQNAWQPSTWDHDNMYFPIFSGQHDGEWDQCSDCHTNPNNYSVFTCLPCHPQGPTNQAHNGVNGYQYNSTACYNCHPNGEAD